MPLSPFEISLNLRGIALPASKDDICDYARARAAEPQVVNALKSLPAGRYNTMADVEKALYRV